MLHREMVDFLGLDRQLHLILYTHDHQIKKLLHTRIIQLHDRTVRQLLEDLLCRVHSVQILRPEQLINEATS